MSSDLKWGGEREASFSKSLFFTKKVGQASRIVHDELFRQD